jgi:glucose/mannose-6-phosphate isomerase
MEDAILNFAAQLSWEPEVKNADKLKVSDKFIVCGMGGSPLGAGFLKANNPFLDLLIHRDYGLPKVPDYLPDGEAGFLRESLIIICSHSGETEETIDAFNTALAQNLNVAVVTTGGKLLKLAQEKGVAHIQLPPEKIQHRMATGHFVRALAKLMNQETVLAETAALATTIKPELLKEAGEKIARRLKGKIPLLYTSNIFYPLAYAWKVNINETAKIPAFVNVLPEADHNEISGFGLSRSGSLPNFRQSFYCLMLSDSTMDERLKRRFVATAALFERQGVTTEMIELSGANSWEKIFNSFLLAGWVSVSLAKHYQLDPETNPVIEEFKQRLA